MGILRERYTPSQCFRKVAKNTEQVRSKLPVLATNELSVNFIVQEDCTDDALIAQREPANENFTDKAILFSMRLTKPFIKMLVGFAGMLDRHGKAPKALRDADGLHSTILSAIWAALAWAEGVPIIIFTSGVRRACLLRWGYSDGCIERRWYKTHTDTMEVGFTKSIKLLQDLLNDPDLLMVKPILPPPPLTKREYRQKLESARKGSKKTS